MTKLLTIEQVKLHNKEDDLWFIVDKNVYDGTKFLKQHPGGEEVFISAIKQDPDLSEKILGVPTHLKKMDKINELLSDMLIGQINVSSETESS